MNTQEGMGVLVSLAGEYALRRRQNLEAIRSEMRAALERGNVNGMIELSKELKNWSLK